MFNLYSILLNNSFSQKFIFILLKKTFKPRYVWTYKKHFLYKIKKPLITNFPLNFKKNLSEKKTLNKIIRIKKLTGLFKRKLNFRITILKRRSFLFKSFNLKNKKKKKNFYFKKKKIYINKFNKFNKFFNKNLYKVYNLSFYNKRKFIFFENRKIIRLFLNNKYLKKQNKLSSYLINFIKKDSKTLLNHFEYKLDVILIKTHIFNNLVDCNFFIKKGLISINSKIAYSNNTQIKTNDLIKITNKIWYYKFYKNNLNSSIASLKKLNWAFYKLKKRNKFKNFFPKVYNWINYNIYFGFDVPYYFEIDYVNLTIFLFIKPLGIFNTNYNSIKYLNFYLTRLYNWSYIV